MAEMKICPYCAEEIKEDAVRCRFCRSRLQSFDAQSWHRSHPEARLGGVCAALAHSLTVPVSVVRIAFVVLTFVHLLGPLVYLLLWAVIPVRRGEESLLETALSRALRAVRSLRGGSPGGGATPEKRAAAGEQHG